MPNLNRKQSLKEYLDDAIQKTETVTQSHTETLNEIFEAWGEIFGTKLINSNKSKNEEENI